MSRIASLVAENVKRLRLVRLRFDGRTFVISGRNGQGKTSVLDAIAMALGGAALVPERPIRQGAKSARAMVTTDDGLVITRRFTATGTSLEVTGADGEPVKSPQRILDGLVGKLGLDPLAFLRDDARKQSEMLRRLVGVDFSVLDAQRSEAYGDRTRVNRDAEAAKVRLGLVPPHYPDTPREPISVAALATELTSATQANRAHAEERALVERQAEVVREGERGLATIDEGIAELERRLAALRVRRAAAAATLEEQRRDHAARDIAARAIVDIDTSDIEKRIGEAEETNRRVASNKARAAQERETDALAAKAEELTHAIEEIDTEKAARLAATTFPVPGLSFDENGILYQGVPFAQASAAEKLRVATAIAFALSPKLRLVMIRDGSLLDDDSMRLLGELAEAHDGQILIERVGAQGTVVIEDGLVAEADAEADDPTAEEVASA